MYYPGSGSANGLSGNNSSERSNGSNGDGTRGFEEPPYYYTRDPWEGQSPIRRKSYMESRQTSKDKTMHMKELENYIHELSNDIVEMMQEASPEEKQMLNKKLVLLANKV
jgi:hypothetical protein